MSKYINGVLLSEPKSHHQGAWWERGKMISHHPWTIRFKLVLSSVSVEMLPNPAEIRVETGLMLIEKSVPSCLLRLAVGLSRIETSCWGCVRKWMELIFWLSESAWKWQTALFGCWYLPVPKQRSSTSRHLGGQAMNQRGVAGGVRIHLLLFQSRVLAIAAGDHDDKDNDDDDDDGMGCDGKIANFSVRVL